MFHSSKAGYMQFFNANITREHYDVTLRSTIRVELFWQVVQLKAKRVLGANYVSVEPDLWANTFPLSFKSD